MLRLGDSIDIVVEPFGDRGRHLRVRSPSTTAWLALGERLVWSGIAIERWRDADLAGWRFATKSGGATLNGTARSAAELARGDELQCDGFALVL